MDDSESKAKSQRQFGQAAGDYATSEIHARGESLDVLLDLTRPQSNWVALDVATGAGHTARCFAPYVARVIATDITRQMLEETQRMAISAGLHNLETRHADAERLPFPDEHFDLVTCRLAMHHFPNPHVALAEFVRVLRPGGQLGLTDNFTVDNPAEADYYNRFERLRDPSHVCVWSLSNLRLAIEQVGFEVLDQKQLFKQLEFQEWADRQRVSHRDKDLLLEMARKAPGALSHMLAPTWKNDTLYFTLWEAVFVARKRAE